MGRHRSMPSVARTRPPTGHPWLGALVEKIDRHLRRRHGVSEYTQSPDCFCRMQIVHTSDDLLLGDGTRVQPGDRVVILHFWTDQVPPMPVGGPTLGWARLMSENFTLSLQELARHLAGRTDIDDVAAVRVDIALGATARSGQISRILSRFGFQVMPRRHPLSIVERIHRYGENVLISLMVFAHNAIALRTDTLVRDRVVAYLSRPVLEQRYGASAKRELRTSQ